VSSDEQNIDHPADVVNLSLIRAKGIVESLSSCFDDRRSRYAVDVPFVAHSVKAVSTLLDEAVVALNELYNACDLTLLETATSAVPDVSVVADDADLKLIEAAPAPSDADQAAIIALRNRSAAFAASEIGTSVSTNDAPAASYDELLQKVTAAEVFATAQSRTSGSEGGMLLPILSSLKQDLMRMRKTGT
jgi:hypothetical protein